MRKDPNEGIEDWAERVRKYELGYALQQIAKGADVNLVLEAMAMRIQNKILHPIFMEIKKNSS